MAKYLDAAGVSTLWRKIKGSFASTGHTHTLASLGVPDSIIIDRGTGAKNRFYSIPNLISNNSAFIITARGVESYYISCGISDGSPMAPKILKLSDTYTKVRGFAYSGSTFYIKLDNYSNCVQIRQIAGTIINITITEVTESDFNSATSLSVIQNIDSSNLSITWSDVSGKPSTFTPSAHTHDYLPLSGGTLTGNLSGTKFHSSASASTDLTVIPNDSQIALETGNGNGSVSAWIWRENYSSSNWGIFHNNSTDVLHIVGNSTSRFSVGLQNGNTNVSGSLTAASFKKSGGTSGQFLKADGSVDSNSYSLSNHSHSNYLQTEQVTADQANITWAQTYGATNPRSFVYNTSGAEWSYLFGFRSDEKYGAVLKMGYNDKYLRILRVNNGTWQSSDWEKISAGYSDSAGDADTLDGQDLMTKVSDWNTATTSIFKSSENSSTNGPTTGFIYGTTLRFHRDTSNYRTDLVIDLYNDKLFFRRHTEGGYQNWREIIHSGNWSSFITTSSIGAAASSHTHSYLPLSGGSISGSGNPILSINTQGSSETGIRIDRSGTGKAWIGYHDSYGVYLYNNARGKYLNYKDDGSLQFEGNTVYHSGNLPAYPTKASWNYDDKYLKLSGGVIDASGAAAPLILKGGKSGYREGLRIVSSGNWSDIILGGNDMTEASGTSANSWFIGNNNGNFYITRNGSSSGTAYLSCVDNAWSINGYSIIHSGNIGSQSVNYANSAGSATSASYLPPKYDGGDKPNPQSYFNENIGAKVAMTRHATIGGTTAWFDTLWINGYAGGDVPNMVALTTIRNGTPRAFLSAQSNRSTTYGTYYELISSYNIASQSVNYATSSGTANSPRGFSFSDRSSSDWTGVPGTFITDWSHSSGADIMFKNDGAKLNVITDGRFYQGIDVYGSSKRVLDEYDITHTTWGDADTLDGYHYNTLYTSVGDWISKVGNTHTITVSGDSDTYYPVVIDATYDKTSRNFISIWKNLGSPTASYPGNHSNGTASMWLIIEGRSCVWDGNGGYYRTIYKSQPYATLVSEATTVYSAVSVLCVYLRGGGTEYKISTTYPTTVRVYLEETNLGSTTYPAIVNPRTNVANGGIINGTFYGNCTGNAASASSVPSLSNSEIDTIMV